MTFMKFRYVKAPVGRLPNRSFIFSWFLLIYIFSYLFPIYFSEKRVKQVTWSFDDKKKCQEKIIGQRGRGRGGERLLFLAFGKRHFHQSYLLSVSRAKFEFDTHYFYITRLFEPTAASKFCSCLFTRFVKPVLHVETHYAIDIPSKTSPKRGKRRACVETWSHISGVASILLASQNWWEDSQCVLLSYIHYPITLMTSWCLTEYLDFLSGFLFLCRIDLKLFWIPPFERRTKLD